MFIIKPISMSQAYCKICTDAGVLSISDESMVRFDGPVKDGFQTGNEVEEIYSPTPEDLLKSLADMLGYNLTKKEG